MVPKQNYRFEIWWKIESPTPTPQVDLRIIFRDPEGTWLSGMDYYPASTHQEGEWVRKSYRVAAPDNFASASVGIWVRDTVGTIRAAKMSVTPIEPGQRTFD